MNKYMYTRKLFPEPADNGGNGGAAPVAPSADNGGGGSPYSLTPTEQGSDTPPAEYALSFDEADGINPAFQELYTSAAKAAELPSAAASKFVHDITARSMQIQQQAFSEAETALQKDWGRDFNVRLEQTASFARRLFDSAGIPSEERRMFENPVAMRLFDALRRSTSEGAASGLNHTATPPAPTKSPEEQIWELSRLISVESNNPAPDYTKIQQMQASIARLAGLDEV